MEPSHGSAGPLNLFRPAPSLVVSSRIGGALRTNERISAAELAVLVAAGALAALAIGMLHLQLRLPGHAILRGVLPMALGFALVPRRSAGIIMSLGAAITAAAMSFGHIGIFPSASVLSILALGPILDVVLLSAAQGWRLYASFAAAGAIANLLAFAVRVFTAVSGSEMAGGGGGGGGGRMRAIQDFQSFWSIALVSFVLCGALAGLISAAACFRLRASDDLRRD